QAWLPEHLAAIVVVAHGYAEHSGRYLQVAEYLAAQGIATFALDQRGHGHSEGERALVGRLSDCVGDLAQFISQVRAEHSAPLFVLGHSMGGAIALQYALNYPQSVDGLITSGAFLLSATPAPPWLRAVVRLLGWIAPRLPVKPLDAALLSRDPAVVSAYDDDPMVYRGKVMARMLDVLLSAGPLVLAQAERLTRPLLILHGGDDKIAAPEGSRRLHALAGASDKTLRVYEGFYHEIFNEKGEIVLADIVHWINTRLAQREFTG
ncbi:MAG: lysophospholipase, partial [Actinobacteria bacterium]|nr:lysophospholipase [Actinomycetota bacterium]